MLSLRHQRSGHGRLVPALVMALQFAAVTWVPSVHPFLHQTQPLPGSANELLADEGTVPGGHVREAGCWACTAHSHVILPAGPIHDWVGDLAEWRSQQPVDRRVPHHTFYPANAVRAPPSP